MATKDDVPKIDWNDRNIVKMHISFYARIGELTKNIDNILSQNAFLCVTAIQDRDKEKFDIYADYIRATIQSDKDLQKRIGRKAAKQLYDTFRKYTKEVREYRKENRKSKFAEWKKRMGFK